jgi:galactokinase
MADIKEEFQKRFQKKPDHIFFSPGRVNLIGEHIDYNGGKVMPCAISLGTYLAISKNTDKVFRFQCLNFPETPNCIYKTPIRKPERNGSTIPWEFWTRFSGSAILFRALTCYSREIFP